MRLLLVADTYPPSRISGALQMRDLAVALARQGHRPLVLTPIDQPGPRVRLEVHDGVQVLRRLDSGDWVRGGQILLGDTEVPSEADKESVKVTEMIAALRAGGVKTAPVTLQVLRLGRWQIGMTP